MRGRRAGIVIVLAVLALVWVPELSALANGSKATRVRYGGTVPMGDGPGKTCQFEVEFEPLLFRLTTMRDKYRLIRVIVRNTSDRKLVLSLTADRMEVQLPAGPRPAVLNLGTHDPELWDSLPADLRKALAYPGSVDAGEERSVFVFIPATEPAATPLALRYTIASLPGGPIVIRDMTPAKRS
jgi:hypothetical protein